MLINGSPKYVPKSKDNVAAAAAALLLHPALASTANEEQKTIHAANTKIALDAALVDIVKEERIKQNAEANLKTTYRLRINSLDLLVKKVTLSERIYAEHKRKLDAGTLLRGYFYRGDNSTHFQK